MNPTCPKFAPCSFPISTTMLNRDLKCESLWNCGSKYHTLMTWRVWWMSKMSTCIHLFQTICAFKHPYHHKRRHSSLLILQCSDLATAASEKPHWCNICGVVYYVAFYINVVITLHLMSNHNAYSLMSCTKMPYVLVLLTRKDNVFQWNKVDIQLFFHSIQYLIDTLFSYSGPRCWFQYILKHNWSLLIVPQLLKHNNHHIAMSITVFSYCIYFNIVHRAAPCTNTKLQCQLCTLFSYLQVKYNVGTRCSS